MVKTETLILMPVALKTSTKYFRKVWVTADHKNDICPGRGTLWYP